MKTFHKLIPLLVLASFSAASQASGYIVDSFNTSQALIIDKIVDGTALTSQQAVAGVLGGYRELIVEKTLQDGGDTGDLGVGLGVTGGKLRYNSDTDASGYGVVRWDGASAGPTINATGLGSVDLASVGNAFVFNVTAADGPFSLTLLAMTSAAQYSSYVVTGTGIGMYTISFADLANPSAALTSVGGGVDLFNLGALELTLTGGLGLDVSIDTVEVPEPASLSLLAISLFATGVARRRTTRK